MRQMNVSLVGVKRSKFKVMMVDGIKMLETGLANVLS